LIDQKNCLQTSLTKELRKFISEGRTKFYLYEFTRASGSNIGEIEDFFLPLLKENEVEGSLEVKCPKCDYEIGTFKTYPDIPKKMNCELCGTSFDKTTECLEIIIDVKKKFFRNRCSQKLDLMNRKVTPSEFKQILKEALTEKNSISKGKKFESFLENLVAQQTGFEFIDKHCR
jgi:phage FluMu protein Com